jgi:hypothetical protein
MKAKNFFAFFIVILILAGCRKTSPNIQDENFITHRSTNKEDASAMTAVAGYWAGRKFNPQELEAISKQIQKDQEAQSALQKVGSTFSGRLSRVRYCPVDGKHFSARLEICPEHTVKLKELEE